MGNVSVCILIYKNTRLRTTTNLYIIALAVSDLLSAVFVMPFGIGALIKGKWVFGETMCEIEAFFVCFVAYVSPVTMCLTAINRYTRICRSDQQYKKLFSAWKSRAFLALVWIFVASYAVVPRLASLQTYAFVPGYGICALAFLSEAGKIMNYCIVLSVFLGIPLVATVFSYIRVAKMIRQHKSDASSAIQRRQKKARISAREIKLSKSLFAVVFAFMMCWIPFWIIIVLKRFLAIMPRNVELLCLFFLYLSNTINPFIYAGMNPVFRREFRMILFCEGKRKVCVGSSGGEAKMEEVDMHTTRARQNCAERSNKLSKLNSLPRLEGAEEGGEMKLEEFSEEVDTRTASFVLCAV